MQRIFFKYLLFIMLFAVISCSKNNNRPNGTASLTIINAVVGSGNLIGNFSSTFPSGTFYSTSNSFSYNTFAAPINQLSSYNGIQKMALYRSPDTMPDSKPLFNLTLDLPIGSINSLFLTGTVNSPDTLFSIDHPPYHDASDSIAGIRFVNLSQGSSPISINISGQANGSEVNSLSYKEITGFKNYGATSNVMNYTFEFRDMASDALLATHYCSAEAYRNYTLAFLGTPNGTGDSAQTTLWIYNY